VPGGVLVVDDDVTVDEGVCAYLHRDGDAVAAAVQHRRRRASRDDPGRPVVPTAQECDLLAFLRSRHRACVRA
jgi:hypothetical protein